jgi:peptide/nickel transport system ATP-binding protein
MNDLLLEVEGLNVSFGRDAPLRVVSDVTFSIAQGEVLGLIGESGSGKTMTGLSILRLLPEHAVCSATALRYQGKAINELDDGDFADLRGKKLAMIFQDPVGSFNPVKSIGWHLGSLLDRTGQHRDEDLAAHLRGVGIHDPNRVLESFPHQLSGGMLQRVLIAMVFALKPSLIIADEPTTNLDNIVEGAILALIRDKQRTLNTSLIFITHDLTIARMICDRIAVMYCGEIVEIGPTDEIIARPRHPYTAGLLRTAQSLERGDATLFEIAGEPGGRVHGHACRFYGRCPDAVEPCRTAHPALVDVQSGSSVRCIHYGS